MATSDKLVLLLIALTTIVVVPLLRRRGARGGRLVIAGWIAFHGVVLTAMMLGHCADIGSRLYIGRGYDGAAMTYSFRIYSLFLLGGVLITCGVQLIRTAFAIASAAAGARPAGLRWAGIALIVVVPLLPIQLFFAVIHTALACITMAVLAVTTDAGVVNTVRVT